jgi:hypothetical protein
VLLGTWRGINLYVSEEQYEDVDGTMKFLVPPKEVLVAATGIQSTMSYAGVSQVNDDATGMKVFEGAQNPARLLGPVRRRLPALATELATDSDPGQHRQLDCAAGARLNEKTKHYKTMNQTYELPQNLGDLMGAYDEAHW